MKKNYSVAIVICNKSENIVISKNLFAKKPKIVREQFRKSSRTICKKFANIFQFLREHRFKPLRTTRKTGIKQLLSRGPEMDIEIIDKSRIIAYSLYRTHVTIKPDSDFGCLAL